MPTAYILVNCTLGSEEEIIAEISKIADIKEVRGTYGVHDIFARPLVGARCKDTLYSQLDFGCTYILSTKGNTPSRKKIFTQLQRDHALELLRMYREHVRKECTLKPDYDDDINRI